MQVTGQLGEILGEVTAAVVVDPPAHAIPLETATAADFVALPQRCDLCGDLLGYLLRRLVSQWSVVESLQQFRQALTLH